MRGDGEDLAVAAGRGAAAGPRRVREHDCPAATQAQRSLLVDYARDSEYHNQGERVVAGQQLMQAVSDIFLGWQCAPLPGCRRADKYYLRQLRTGTTPPRSNA